ncbi:hypothetical protein UlMin_043443, partial [Ulmus minor]
MEKKKYPIGPEYYTLFEEVGHGVSASVRRALCLPLDEVVAIKIFDFERDNIDLNSISREAQTMILVDHPNVLKAHCSFVTEHALWVVMPFMAGGSCLHILKAAYPDGFGEAVIATILRETLKGLEYLHHHGHIHRDIKAGNILIDSRGSIKLGDFGVSACLFDSGDRQRTRNTFVGTPCWMAPEVMQNFHGYDFKADIWSFGITALELAHGHAPFSKYPPMKVLLMTLQNAPPGLDYERDRKFSKSFKQMIASCLVKDPSKRPSAHKLLKHTFFKQARSNDYIVRTLLEGLPALGDRIKALKRKEEDLLAQQQMVDEEREEMSQNEYKRGISGWNFNLEDVKAEASLIPDIDDSMSDNSQLGSSSSLSALDAHEKQLKCQNLCQVADTEHNFVTQNNPALLKLVNSTLYEASTSQRCDKSDDEFSIASTSHEQHISHGSSPRYFDYHAENNLAELDLENSRKLLEAKAVYFQHRFQSTSGGTSLPEFTNPPIQNSDKLLEQARSNSNGDAAVPLHLVDEVLSDGSSGASKSIGNSGELDEKAKVPFVQQRGRFKVTSENVDIEKVTPTPMMHKSNSMQVITSNPQVPLPSTPSLILSPPSSLPSPLPSPSHATSSAQLNFSLYQMLLPVLQSNVIQRENILHIFKHFSAGDQIGYASNQAIERSLLEESNDRETSLLNELSELTW